MSFDEPILFFGGPYSNLEATQALLTEAKNRGIAANRIVCTGDVVAYGADPKSCVDLLRTAEIQIVMGNCEEQLAANADDCGCGFSPGSKCDTWSNAWFSHARASLRADDRAWLATLPRRINVAIGGLKLAVVHGSLLEISRFVFASTPDRVKGLELALSGADGIVAGHCGLPFSQVIDGRLWHNPGAIGMPANDGTPRVWLSIVTPGASSRSVTIEHLALDYDHVRAATAMRSAGLPEPYALALSSGLWPSCDVLLVPEAKSQGVRLVPGALIWRRDETAEPQSAWPRSAAPVPIDPQKFQDPRSTVAGERRASVELSELKTLWINTGTLCNLACSNCYIESSPRNDRLVYIRADEVRLYLDEIPRARLGTDLIGFTGGEPFMNPHLLTMLDDVLSRGLKALVLTNAMKPMQRHAPALLGLQERYGSQLSVRVSIDHYTRELHELERGPRSWTPTMDGMSWLVRNGFAVSVAGRLYSGETEGVVRAGYARLFAERVIPLDAFDPAHLVLFPEMDEHVDVPEISEACWGVLGKKPTDVMCSSSRMVVKRKGAERPTVLACTLLVDDPQFELGSTLAEASRPVPLNHPHCAKFCVLGGGACSG